MRAWKELFVTGFGAELGKVDSWVMDRLTAMLQEEDVYAGEQLFSRGSAPEYFYFLRKGGVRLERPAMAPQLLEGPAVIGMFDAVLDRPWLHTATILGEAEMMKVPLDDWIELLEDSFELARASVQSAARHVALLEAGLLEEGRAPWSAPPSFAAVATGARLGVVERIAVLMDAMPLRAAGVQTLSDLALVCEETTFAPGDVLFDRGATGDRVFLVVDGLVTASRGPSGDGLTFGPGQILCGAAALLAAFGEEPLSWTARASSAVRTLAFRTEDWFDLMEEHFDLVRSALAGLALERERLAELVASRPSQAPSSMPTDRAHRTSSPVGSTRPKTPAASSIGSDST
jgi:CRP-like cAMP-binding protein